VFHSRRPPVAAVLYSIMIVGAISLLAALSIPAVAGVVIVVMVMSVLGVHGVLSGTASADFGGKKNAGVATGIIDGFVYAGVGIQSLFLGHVLPQKDTPAAALVGNWKVWPLTMLPVAVLGIVLASRVWNAKPQPKSAPPPPAAPPALETEKPAAEAH
jgi:OPA family glycerol-3-phosphate transporter-like MFS transporter